MKIDKNYEGLTYNEELCRYEIQGDLISDEGIEIYLDADLYVSLSIKAGEGIEAGWGIKAGWGIEAGDGIEAGEAFTIFAGVRVRYSVLTEIKIRCKKLVSGHVMSGTLEESDVNDGRADEET